MQWERWQKTKNTPSATAAYAFLSAYIEALFDRGQVPEEAVLGLVYIQEGGRTYFFVVDTADMGACLDIPLCVGEIAEDDPALKEFTQVKSQKRSLATVC